MPRMRMYADAEEKRSKTHTKKIQQRISSSRHMISGDRQRHPFDLRSKLAFRNSRSRRHYSNGSDGEY